MSTLIKHHPLCAAWDIAPKRIKAALYVAHRERVQARINKKGFFK